MGDEVIFFDCTFCGNQLGFRVGKDSNLNTKAREACNRYGWLWDSHTVVICPECQEVGYTFSHAVEHGGKI